MTDHSRPMSRDGFSIAVLCALKREAKAVVAVLDEEWESAAQHYGKSANDDNSYTFGLLGGKPVVLAYASMGKVAAANASKDLKASFRNINLLLVVGVCGGAPKHPVTGAVINPGDIAISTQVIQGDFGRIYKDGFERKTEVEDTLRRASPEIRNFVTKLSAIKRTTERTNLYLVNALQHTLHENDIRYPADIENALVQQQDVRPVNLHFGRIISTDSVIKDASYRDDAILRERAIAFEMESAGTWETAPTILVKGVCDYADANKNKDWQDFAALSAAACAKVIAEEWVIRVESRLERIRTAKPHHTTAMYRDLLRALDSVDPDANLMEAKSRTRGGSATEGTCRWIFGSDEYQGWDTATQDCLLVCSGEPGIGKTTMATVIVDRLRKDQHTDCSTTVHFFCDNKVEQRRTVLAILRGLLYQVLNHYPHLCEPIQQKFDSLNKLFGKFSSIWPLFEDTLSAPNLGKMYIVIDALDECEELNRTEFLNELCSLLARSEAEQANGTTLKLLLLTRPNLTTEVLGNQPEKEHHIKLDREKIKDDLQVYIDKEVANLVKKRQWSAATHQAIEEELGSRHGGTYLWVALAVKDIARSKVREHNVLETLKQSPSDLNDVYIRILREIDETDHAYAPYVLRYVLASPSLNHFSKEANEVTVAVLLHFKQRVKPGTRPLPSLEETRRLQAAVSACEMLVYKNESLGLKFIHQSVKDFLTGQSIPHDLLAYKTSDSEAVAAYRSALKGYLEAEEFEQLANLDREWLKLIVRRKAGVLQDTELPSFERFDHITTAHLAPLKDAVSMVHMDVRLKECPAIVRFMSYGESFSPELTLAVRALLKSMVEQERTALFIVHFSILYECRYHGLHTAMPSMLGVALGGGHSVLAKYIFDSAAKAHVVQGLIARFRDDDGAVRIFQSLLQEHRAELAGCGIGRTQFLRFAIIAANPSFIKRFFESLVENLDANPRPLHAMLNCHWLVYRYRRQGADDCTWELVLPFDMEAKSRLSAEGFSDSRALDASESLRLCHLVQQVQQNDDSLLTLLRSGDTAETWLHNSGDGGDSVSRLSALVHQHVNEVESPLFKSGIYEGQWPRESFEVSFWRPLDYAMDLWRRIPDERRRDVVSFLIEQMRDAELLEEAEYGAIVEELATAKEKTVDWGLDEMISEDADVDEIDWNEVCPLPISWHGKAITRTKKRGEAALLAQQRRGRLK